MFFATLCPHCQKSNRTELSDNGIHPLKCGHCGKKYCVYVRKQKFEMLFDLGTKALLDGYGREAVASFAASLERFFEFYVRVYALERASGGTQDFEKVQEGFNKMWRHVASQSERQLGMFAFAYFLREGKEPDFLQPKAMGTDFRNQVIHRGYLPRQAEVEEYAAKVFALIDRLLSQLGAATAQAELWQAYQYDQHLRTLPADTVAVFEEHPGMFRARRFSQTELTKSSSALSPLLHSAQASRTPHNGNASHSAIFQQAIAERGKWLKLFG